MPQSVDRSECPTAAHPSPDPCHDTVDRACGERVAHPRVGCLQWARAARSSTTQDGSPSSSWRASRSCATTEWTGSSRHALAKCSPPPSAVRRCSTRSATRRAEPRVGCSRGSTSGAPPTGARTRPTAAPALEPASRSTRGGLTGARAADSPRPPPRPGPTRARASCCRRSRPCRSRSPRSWCGGGSPSRRGPRTASLPTSTSRRIPRRRGQRSAAPPRSRSPPTAPTCPPTCSTTGSSVAPSGPGHAPVGELDVGRVGRLLRPDEDPGEVVFEEKRARTRSARSTGAWMVRLSGPTSTSRPTAARSAPCSPAQLTRSWTDSAWR